MDAGLVLAGRYRLGEVLGRGGMGKVWRAHDEVLHRTVAVKELTAGQYATEADRSVLHARTQKEARAAARITHPAVVTVHDVIEHDNRPWIVMQYVDGRSLADAVQEADGVAPREAARIGLQVLGALRAAHGAGVLHRDVKPGNVLLAADSRVLLTDFGIAAIEGDSTITRTGEIVGSIDYLAPERIRGEAPGPASDLWSLGATLYSAVEGRSPFRRTTPISTMQAVVTEEPPAPGRAGPLAPVIDALLRKEPAERPSAAETERMLLDAMEGREPRTERMDAPTRRVPGEPLHAFAPDTAPGTAGATSTVGVARTPAASPGTADGAAAGPAPTPPRRRGRWRTAVLVVVAAAVIGGGGGFLVLKYAGGPDGNASTARHDNPADHGTDTPGTDSRGTGATSTPRASGAADPVPDGWHRVNDPEGFSLLVPDGWERRTTGGQIDYTPDGGLHYIRIGVDPDPEFENAHAHALSLEQLLTERLPGYRREALEANTYRDRPGSLWEFTWTETKNVPGPRHAIDQMYFGAAGGPEYALYLTGPAEDWDTTRAQFDTILRSWREPGASG